MALPALRTAMRCGLAGPSSVPLRTLSTTAPVFASKKSSKGKGKEKKIINPDAMPLDEAVRVLRALEIANPSSSYTIEIKCKDQKVLLRGRVQLPSDPRKTADVIVVFAEPGSPSEEAAKKAGATIVGGAELFPKILSGEIAPTKVLSATGMLPSVSRNLARFLGPKNLMPTVKRGNVGDGAELARMIKEAGGALDFRADKEGLVKSLVARANFSPSAVETNVRAFIQAVHDQAARNLGDTQDALERAAKASFVTRARIETTNGPMIEISDVP